MGIREDVYYEGGPHIGDLIINVLLAFTIICLPLTVAAITGRSGFGIALPTAAFQLPGAGWGEIAPTSFIPKFVKLLQCPEVLGFGEIW
jgi:hypothetical protein